MRYFYTIILFLLHTLIIIKALGSIHILRNQKFPILDPLSIQKEHFHALEKMGPSTGSLVVKELTSQYLKLVIGWVTVSGSALSIGLDSKKPNAEKLTPHILAHKSSFCRENSTDIGANQFLAKF